jgi:hypothetical protein
MQYYILASCCTVLFNGYCRFSVCVLFYCMLVSTVFHYMFRPTWPSSSVQDSSYIYFRMLKGFCFAAFFFCVVTLWTTGQKSQAWNSIHTSGCWQEMHLWIRKLQQWFSLKLVISVQCLSEWWLSSLMCLASPVESSCVVRLLLLVTLVQGVLGHGWDGKFIAVDGGVFPALGIYKFWYCWHCSVSK